MRDDLACEYLPERSFPKVNVMGTGEESAEVVGSLFLPQIKK